MTEEIPLAEVSFMTFQAIVQVIIVCSSGFLAAKIGVLNKTAQKYVNELNMFIFTPAMIFSNLAPELSVKKLFDIFIIPVFYAALTGASYLSAHVSSHYLGLGEAETNFVTAMSVFGNCNSLPVYLTLDLAYTLPGLEWSKVDNDDAKKIASRGLLYLVIFQQIGQVLRWSWGYNTLLKRRDSPDGAHFTVEDTNGNAVSKNGYSRITTEAVEDETASSSTEYTPLLSLRPPSLGSPLSPQRLTLKERVNTIYTHFLDAMNPPLWAMVAALLVASIKPVHDAFYIDNGFTQNTISKAIDDLGEVCIPLILIVLGSNLYPSPDTPPESPHYNRIVIASLVSRMIIPTIVVIPIISITVKLFHFSILSDPIFLIVVFLLTTAAPAIQLSQIVQLNELFEMEMAGILFWGYVILTLPTTIGVVAGATSVISWAKNSGA